MNPEVEAALLEILDQIAQLAGAAGDAVRQGGQGSGPDTGAPAPEQGAPPAPPTGE